MSCENGRALGNFLKLRKGPRHEIHRGNHYQREVICLAPSERRTRLRRVDNDRWAIESPNPEVRRKIHDGYKTLVVHDILGEERSLEFQHHLERFRDDIGKVFPLYHRARVTRRDSHSA